MEGCAELYRGESMRAHPRHLVYAIFLGVVLLIVATVALGVW
jgi:hypothetical protein